MTLTIFSSPSIASHSLCVFVCKRMCVCAQSVLQACSPQGSLSLCEIEAGVAYIQTTQMHCKWISHTHKAETSWWQLCLRWWIIMSFQHVFSSHLEEMVKLYYPCVHMGTPVFYQLGFLLKKMPFFQDCSLWSTWSSLFTSPAPLEIACHSEWLTEGKTLVIGHLPLPICGVPLLHFS